MISAKLKKVTVSKIGKTTTSIASKSYIIKPGTFYKLKVEINGKNIDVYINNSKIISTVDNQNTCAACGYTGIRASKADAKFDNVSFVYTGGM